MTLNLHAHDGQILHRACKLARSPMCALSIRSQQLIYSQGSGHGHNGFKTGGGTLPYHSITCSSDVAVICIYYDDVATS